MPRRKAQQFDVVVIGGGAAGLAAAQAAHDEGASVCIVEREALGGDCVQWSCVPTKSLLQAAKTYARTQRAELFGVMVDDVRFRYSHIARRKDAVVGAVTGEGKRLPRWAESMGIAVVYGEAAFVDAHTLAVGKQRIAGKAFVIATGSIDVIPSIAGIHEVPYLTSRDVVSLKQLPSSAVIVGAGPVGCEIATLFGAFEVRTLLCEVNTHVLPREEPELAALAAAHLRGVGVDVAEHTKVLAVAKRGKRLVVTYQRGTQSRKTTTVDALVLAAGRRPRVDGLQVPAGRHVWFAGDASGGPQFTHVAHAQGVVAGRQAAGMQRGKAPAPVVPRVTFVDPELASVGITELQARKAGYNIAVGRTVVGALSRAVIDDERDGLLKVIVDAKTDKVLGAHMLGAHAGEVIHELALAMHLGASFTRVASMLHAFPTYAEVIPACQFD